MLELPLVTLRGGLGNQLFQLAFLLSTNHTETVFLEIYSGYLEETEDPDLLKFELPKRVKISTDIYFKNWILKSIGSRLLRLGTLVSRRKILLPILVIIETASSIVFSIIFRKKVRLRAAIGNGYDARISVRQKNNQINLGFFQSYRWLIDPRTLAEMKSLVPKFMSNELAQHIEKAKLNKPVILHVRLGDYLEDATRGIPNKNYYVEALNQLLDNEPLREVWVFSDDIESAKRRLNLEYQNLRWVSRINNSDVETFELMRYGNAYVLGNSSFSWWAASLSYTEKPDVIAPNPWFINSPDPKDLIWKNWKTCNAWEN